MENHDRHTIDRQSPLPVYQQIAFDISTRIRQGEWCIGAKIPSETELTEYYDVSRVTVHQALAKLQQEGLIDKQRGKGTFVKRMPGTTVQDLYLPQDGQRPTGDVVSRDITWSIMQDVPETIISQLQLKPNAPVVFLERRFERDGRIVAISNAWFPAYMVPGITELPLIDNSVTSTLQKRYSIHFGTVHNYIEAVITSLRVAQQLEVPQQSPGLKITSLYMNRDGVPFEFSSTIWNGTDTEFHVILSSAK